uniref:HpcH_HpaI domain-containing protein n=1 Tax=Syphacia muris TaxID=451379 RepID=A0A0N5AWK3_9BILA
LFRLVHILVQARTGETCSARCSSSYNQDDYFGLHIEELNEVAEFLDKNVQNYPPSAQNLTVDFLMCIDNCYLPMESWCISVTNVDNVDQNKEPASFFDSSKLSLDVSTLLKASIAAARATPMFRTISLDVFYRVEFEYRDVFEILFGKRVNCLILYCNLSHLLLRNVGLNCEVYEGPPIIELGGKQKRRNVGKVSTSLGTISLDVFYRVEFETCKDSCCSREGLREKRYKMRRTTGKRSESDAGTYLPFSPSDGLITMRTASEAAVLNKNKQDEAKADIQERKILFYLEKPLSTSGSSGSSLTDTKSFELSSSVPFFALLTASSSENRICHENNQSETVFGDSKKSIDEVAEGSAMYESVASTLVFSPSESEIAPDSKASYYSFVDSDNDSTNSQADENSENSFIKVPFALLPTGDPSNVGDFIMFLRRCEVQEFAFTFEKVDLLLKQLSQFETWQHTFDSFLAEITENAEVVNCSAFSTASAKPRTKYVPRRALLYVPGSSEKMLKKVPGIKVDSLVLEMEDGVAANAKSEARVNIRKYLDSTAGLGKHNCFELGVRVNSVASELIFEDVKELAKAEHLPQAFMIPKIDSVEDLAAVFDVFRTAYGDRRILNTDIRMIIWIESARALLDMPRILNAALNLHKSAGFFKTDAIVFGSDDFCANIGLFF